MALLIGVLMCAFVGLEQRHVWGRPDLDATVSVVERSDRRVDCGKGCRCDEARFRLVVEDGAPASFTGCEEDYSAGEALVVRRERDEPEHVFADPLSGGTVPVLGVITALVVVVGAGLLAALRSAWESARDRLPWAKAARRRLAAG